MSDFLDLDSLLSESMVQRAARLEEKSSKEKRPGKNTKLRDPSMRQERQQIHWMNAGEAEAYRRDVNSVEANSQWKAIAAVAMFSTQICLCCGTTSTHFEGFFLHQEHKKSPGSERWIPADNAMQIGLPKFRKTNLHEADSCSACAAALGFASPSPTVSEPFYAAWSPRKNYQVYSDQSEYPRGLVRSTKTSSLE